jgi:hypothetical protein
MIVSLVVCAWPAMVVAQQTTQQTTQQTKPSAERQQASEASSKQPDALITDRPDFTESSSTVPAMRLQLEAGLQYTHNDLVDGAQPPGHTGSFDSNSVSAPNLLLRFGVSDFAELRLGVPNVAYESITGGGDDIVFGELSLGAKLATALADTVRIGVIPFADVGTESGHFGGGVITTAAVDVTETVGLGVNAGLTTYVDHLDERQYEGRTSVAIGFGMTEKLGGFVETYALIPEGDVDLFVDTGLTYLLTPTVQLDAYLGTHVPDAYQIFAGAGVSTLF